MLSTLAEEHPARTCSQEAQLGGPVGRVVGEEDKAMRSEWLVVVIEVLVLVGDDTGVGYGAFG